MQSFHFRVENFGDSDFAHFFEDGTKLKIPFEIKPGFENTSVNIINIFIDLGLFVRSGELKPHLNIALVRHL